MGVVNCPKHGLRGGPLCCEHILNDVYAHAVGGRCAGVSYTSLQCDLGNDGIVILQYRICGACGAQYGLLHQHQIDEDIAFDKQRFPWVAPVCAHCLRAYEMAL